MPISEESIRIVVVDDHVVLRDGLVTLLRAQPDFQVLGEAGSVEEALAVVRQTEPDLVLMDYSLPDGTGPEAAREILGFLPSVRIVFLTVHEEDDALFTAIRSGVKGYLLKNISSADLLCQLRGVVKGEAAISGEMTSRVLSAFARTANPRQEPADGMALTERELEVLRELARGATNQEIADRLFISIHTVKNHVHSILEKLSVDNRREAAKRALKDRLI